MKEDNESAKRFLRSCEDILINNLRIQMRKGGKELPLNPSKDDLKASIFDEQDVKDMKELLWEVSAKHEEFNNIIVSEKQMLEIRQIHKQQKEN
jgi:hypothetical protein